ncbi:hypothetical protein HanIR_Chr11g0519701 [Helianthus annuus]|nr:hypothetical protein HanIR_Chr11g0519701 [Helianthus annuus]
MKIKLVEGPNTIKIQASARRCVVEAFCTQWGIDPKFNPVAQVWTNLSIYV